MDHGSGAWLTFSHVRLGLGKMVLIGNEGLEEGAGDALQLE